MNRDWQIGDRVRYIPGYKGYFAAEVVGFDCLPLLGTRVVIEFSSGKRVDCWPDELEEA